MKRRVFICSNTIFPRGCASANYIQYLAMALIEKNCEVIVISFGDKGSCEYLKNEGRYRYKSIIFDEIRIRAFKPLHWLDYKYRLGSIITGILNKYRPASHDLIIAYFAQRNVLKALLDYSRKKKVRAAACIGEWYPKSHFKHDILGFRYRAYAGVFKKLYPEFDLVMPVSTYLNDYLKSLGCNTFILPPLADPYEHCSLLPKTKDGIIRYLFIGKHQDSPEIVIKAFELLPEELLAKAELHLKGISQKQVKGIISPAMHKYIGSKIICHGWMEYGRLAKLYKNTDFLLLARETNQETLSNFPSKIPEAMSYGVIPIASRVGDYTGYYLADGADSILVGECRVQSFSDAIIRSLSMDDKARKAMSERAYATACSRFYYRLWKDRIYNALFNNINRSSYENYAFDYGTEGTAVR